MQVNTLTAPDTDRPAAAGEGKMDIRVLLVEDDAVDSRWVQRQLSAYTRANFHLAMTTRLEWGLKNMDSVFYDAVLLDLNLPDSHGGETILRTLMHSSSVPVIVLSGNRDQHLSDAARRRGIYAYLVKAATTMYQLPRIVHDAVLERRMMQAEEADQPIPGTDYH